MKTGLPMRNWETREGLEYLGRVIAVLQGGGVLSPEPTSSALLDLRGFKLPPVSQFELAGVPVPYIKGIAGHLEFRNAKVKDVDFTNSRLAFSVWNNCVFENVCFDRTSLNQVRFFGCRFVGCTFQLADLRDCSFSIGYNGAETEIETSVFDRTDFRGASCSNPVFRSTAFVSCRLDGFVFDGAACEHVIFKGKYKELTFRGVPRDVVRNRLQLDLSCASIMWLNADNGIDFEQVIIPADGSAMVIKDRLRAIEYLCSRLAIEGGDAGRLAATVLKGVFSDRAISALEPSQGMIFVSKAMLADFAETDDPDAVNALFDLVCSIARSGDFLLTNNVAE